MSVNDVRDGRDKRAIECDGLSGRKRLAIGLQDRLTRKVSARSLRDACTDLPFQSRNYALQC